MKRTGCRKSIKKGLLCAIIFFYWTGLALGYTTYRGYTQLPEPLPTSEGELLFQESGCVICHGIQGDGNGFLANGLDPKPRDFTSYQQMKNLPDLQIENTIRFGSKGTAMPAHPDLSDNQIQEVIYYIRSLLADTYLTLNVCLSETFVVDLEKERVDLKNFRIEVTDPTLISVERKGRLVFLTPNRDWEVFKRFLKKKTTRTHVLLVDQNNTVAMLAVRLHRCVK
ncbi:MAG: hypothetical protein COV67_06710 [Nitrospinae bacterium CG11_big_fil_rev_8_21_14_0_20_56_8]|nr:MAG: hypothetical protein COV67_06710 [Nitrospinae bacterium CG11_big_fil_rev_8_21_14_0_20_56_8]